MTEKGITTFKHNSRLTFLDSLKKIAGTQLLYINVTQYSALLTCLYGRVTEEKYKPVELLRYFASDYKKKNM